MIHETSTSESYTSSDVSDNPTGTSNHNNSQNTCLRKIRHLMDPLSCCLANPNHITAALSEAALISLANDRIVENKLITPSDDNALYYYLAAIIRDPENEEARLGAHLVIQNVSQRALSFAHNSDYARAEQLLDQMPDVVLTAESLLSTRERIRQIKREQATNSPLDIESFVVEQMVHSQYAIRALQRSIEGPIKVTFVVDENGETKNIEILESPRRLAGKFNDAAITAVSQWRFKPQLLDDLPIARQTETTITFQLDNTN